MKTLLFCLGLSLAIPATPLLAGNSKNKSSESKKKDKKKKKKKDEIDHLLPETIVKLPVYDEDGKKIKTRKVTGEEMWEEINSWEKKIRSKAKSRSSSKDQIKTKVIFDEEVGEDVETVFIPQDSEQRVALEKQLKPELTLRPAVIDLPGLRPVLRPVTPILIDGGEFVPLPTPVDGGGGLEPTPNFFKSINNNFGTKSLFAAFQNANFDTLANSFGTNAAQRFGAGGFVFGKRISLVEQSTKSSSDRRSATTTTDVKVLDQSIFVSSNGTVNVNKTLTRSKRKSKTFFIGIPISVGGKVSGLMGANLNYNAKPLNFTGTLTPILNVGGSVDAGINLLVIKAGVEGRLTFVKAEVPATLNASLDLDDLRASAGLKVETKNNFLSGSVSVFVKIFRLFRGFKKFSKTIFSFNGIDVNKVLIDEELSVKL